jgi:hypothetical protein
MVRKYQLQEWHSSRGGIVHFVSSGDFGVRRDAKSDGSVWGIKEERPVPVSTPAFAGTVSVYIQDVIARGPS